jgi:diguanylate cyclase (GGDEF)-like protein
VSVWENAIARPLRALHLDTIKGKVLAFGVFAILFPTVVTLVSYRQNPQPLDDTVGQQLRSVSSEAARELNDWLTERLSDLRAAASSYVVSENMARIRPGSAGSQAVGRLRDYLNSVRERCTGCEALLVIDARGRAAASSGGRTSGMQLTLERLNGLQTGEALVGDAYWDAGVGKPAIILAVPIRETDGRFLGALTAKINLRSVADILQRLSPGEPGDVYLVTDEGKLVMRSRVSSAEVMRTRLSKTTIQALLDGEGTNVAYKRADGQEFLATLRRVPQLHLAAVAELPRAEAQRQVARPSGSPGVVLVAVLAGVGLMAAGLGVFIVRPLGRLTKAAARVAGGDLSVDLPVVSTGELGFLTQVFNTLISRLRERESQAELERLSVTDALTGLYNRRHLMETLSSEAQRSRRLRRPFSVLLADVDHFKQYNDTHGHVAGDAALTKVADILRKTTRAVDCVARYGGEEFLVVLLETTVTTAVLVAERIRSRVAGEAFGEGRMSLSIGVAECPAHGDTPETLIASADAAMYQAKAGGRDRVVAVGGEPQNKTRERRA